MPFRHQFPAKCKQLRNIGVGKLGDRLIIMLDLTMVISSEEKRELETVESAQ